MNSILFIQNISLTKSFRTHRSKRYTFFSHLLHTQLVMWDTQPRYPRTISLVHFLFLVIVKKSKNRNQSLYRIKREKSGFFFFLFFEFLRNEIQKKGVKIRLSVHICKREAQPQDNIKRESTINQNKTMSISARVKLDKCSIVYTHKTMIYHRVFFTSTKKTTTVKTFRIKSRKLKAPYRGILGATSPYTSLTPILSI